MKLLFLFLISLNLYAGKIEKLAVNSEINSDLLKGIASHLKGSEHGDKYIRSIKESITSINQNAKYFKRSELISFINIIFYKMVLNYHKDKFNKGEQITSSQIFILRKKFNENKIVYTQFSQYILQALINDFAPYLEKDFIIHYQNKSRRESKQLEMIRELKIKEKFLLPWINIAISRSAVNFNNMINNFIAKYLAAIANRMAVYPLLGKVDLGNGAIFTDIKFKVDMPTEPTESITAAPDNDVKILDDVKDSAASEVIDKIIEKIPE